jgi:hypothetical protein
MTGYNLQDIPGSGRPASPSYEHRLWYQWYFQTERGRAGLESNRKEICRLLWNLWSPNWIFDDTRFEASARSFENPDFVEVTIQSYRHRYGNAAGDPALEPIAFTRRKASYSCSYDRAARSLRWSHATRELCASCATLHDAL